MTQPAKVQEPSMEEILASIRRIIADDEAKPAGRRSQARPAPAPPRRNRRSTAAEAVRDEGHPAVGDCTARRSRPRAKPAPPPPRRAGAAAASNSQDDIDAMLAGLDEATTPEDDIRPAQPDGRRVRTHRRDGAAGSGAGAAARSTRSSRRTTSNSPKAPPPRRAPAAGVSSRRRSKAQAAGAADPVALDRVGRRIRLQFAGQYRAEQQRADAGRSGQGNAAADAEILARRQSARDWWSASSRPRSSGFPAGADPEEPGRHRLQPPKRRFRP